METRLSARWKLPGLALLFCAGGLAACQSSIELDVVLTGRPDEAGSVLVTASLDGVPAIGTGQSLTRTRDRFRVVIPEPLSGRYALHVSAQNSGGCELAVGDGQLMIPGAGSYSLTIDMQPHIGCSLEVELVGPASGSVTSKLPGIDCGEQCRKTYLLKDIVSLVPATTELFGGWFSNSESGCSGRLSCTITIGSGVTRVRANFIHKSACTASGWCIEEDLPNINSALYGLWGSSRDDVWAVGDFGAILHGDGILWKEVPAVTSRALRGIWGSDPQNVYAVGESGTILHYDGVSWRSMAAPTSAWLNAIWGNGASDVWAVGDGGVILHFNGSEWAASQSGTTQSLRGVWGSGPQEVWAVGDAGTVQRWGGATWDTYGDGITSGSLYGVWGTGTRNVWMVGDGGVILQWTGSRPLVQTKIVGVGGLHAVWGLLDRQAWAVGDGGVILSRNDTAWTLVDNRPSNGTLNAIWGSSLLDVWTLGGARTINRYRP